MEDIANLDIISKKGTPKIYVYEEIDNPNYSGYVKVGYTKRDVIERLREQYVVKPGNSSPFRLLHVEEAVRNDGTSFTDKDVHEVLKNSGIRNLEGFSIAKNKKVPSEWFECNVDIVKAAIASVKENKNCINMNHLSYKMRKEQEEAVLRTKEYFQNYKQQENGDAPRFLWNCKMRFGKTFAAYNLVKEMNFEHVLVVTFKPAVSDSWKRELLFHKNFEKWTFVHSGPNAEEEYENADKNYPVICFCSLQDLLGSKSKGKVKEKNEWIHRITWDLVIFDEYHFGAWRDNTKEFFENENTKEIDNLEKDFDVEIPPVVARHYLYLSGTPFRALTDGEFIEEQIFNWTYNDEQKAKEEWKGPGKNPYECLPKMIFMVYTLPKELKKFIEEGEYDEFSLNEFFSAKFTDKNIAEFKYKDKVKIFLDFVCGKYLPVEIKNFRDKSTEAVFPYGNADLSKKLSHTVWFLPDVASCYAMGNLLKEHIFFKNFEIVVAAGPAAGIGAAALPPVFSAMGNPLKTRTITLTCGKLLTGVTVPPWSGIFMLCNCKAPETYFQAAFRVQNSWTIVNPDGLSPNKEIILKKDCFVFDFDPNRAFRHIVEYSCRLNTNEKDPEKKIGEFTKFMPIFAYDGLYMRRINATDLLDIVTSQTSASLLARRWQSSLLVNVDNHTLENILNNQNVLNVLDKIESFRALGTPVKDVLTIIINKNKVIKNLRTKSYKKDLTSEEESKLKKERKERDSLRKELREKLIKFIIRIPIFLYLTDHREKTLYEIITTYDSDLFEKVTGITVNDFELLIENNVFNEEVLNDAIYKFKRYEDSSLIYADINKHGSEVVVGLFNKTISKEEYEREILSSKNKESKEVKNEENTLDKENESKLVEKTAIEFSKKTEIPNYYNETLYKDIWNEEKSSNNHIRKSDIAGEKGTNLEFSIEEKVAVVSNNNSTNIDENKKFDKKKFENDIENSTKSEKKNEIEHIPIFRRIMNFFGFGRTY